MLVLDGKKLNQEIASELKEAISALGEKKEKIPHLLIIQIGEDPASDIYIQKKVDFGQEIGVKVTVKYFSENVSEDEVLNFIEEKNNDLDVNGIIVQIPIPDKLNRKKILASVSKEKDVDGLADSRFVPATTKGVITLLQKNNIEISGKKIVIINDSDLIGKPTAREIERLGGKVFITNDKTEKLEEISQSSDILITAIGKPEIIDEKYLKEGQVVIDIGITKTENGIRGDVKRNLFLENGEPLKLFALTPVPGGVGPMTVASLFENLFDAYKKQNTSV